MYKFRSKIVAGLCLAVSLHATTAFAQQYPNAPVKILCGFTAGGSTDAAARLAAKWLGDELKQAFVVDNKVGANGLLAIQTLKQSKPDGYTLMMASGGSITVTPAVKKNAGYDSMKDFDPVAIVGFYPYVLVSRLSFPANNVAELIDYAKKNPGKVSYGSAGLGSTNHMAGEWFARLTGTTLNHIPYKGDTPAVADLLAERLDIDFMTPSNIMPHVKAGKVKTLGSTGTSPSPLIEGENRMVSATVPHYEIGSWLGLMAPAGTPPAIVDRLNKILNEKMQTPEGKEQMLAVGMVPIIVTPAQFKQRIGSELKNWTAVATSSKIEID